MSMPQMLLVCGGKIKTPGYLQMLAMLVEHVQCLSMSQQHASENRMIGAKASRQREQRQAHPGRA